MATRIRVLLTDDLDGGEAAGTVRFALDGAEYEIDLNEENTARLREDLAPWIGHARRVRGPAAGGEAASGPAAGGPGAGGEIARVRRWAQENGHVVNERGRLPSAVLQAYRDATA